MELQRQGQTVITSMELQRQGQTVITSNKGGNHIARLLPFDHGLGRKLNLTH